MSFRKILCATDFSPGSQDAMRVAVRLAAGSDAELAVAHVWHLPPLSFAGENPIPPDVIRQMIEDEQRGLAAAADEAGKLGARRVTSRFLTGVPWDQLVDALDGDAAFDLVVVGAQGRTGIARLLLGSVTEKVVRHAPCSVLVVRPHGDRAAFARVLCPVDFSDSSYHAVERTAELAGTAITLLHVVELAMPYAGAPYASELRRGVEALSADMLDDWASDLRARVAVEVTSEIRRGSPGAQTLAVLHDHPEIDLVVMGSHGRTGLRRAMLGSVAEKVVRHASCPVLVARMRRA